jgi:hypothetical protein
VESDLTTNQKYDLDMFEFQAIAYVWGWQDASNTGANATGWATKFGQTYRAHALAAMRSEISVRHSIPVAHAYYRAGRSIERESY